MTAPTDITTAICNMVQTMNGRATGPHDDLHLDALDRVTLTCGVEESYNVEFSDRQIEAFRTPGEIACAVAQIRGIEIGR